MTERVCCHCAWWAAYELTNMDPNPQIIGRCHFSAPRVNLVNGNPFPLVAGSDFCRHWAAERGWGEGKEL